MNIKDSSALLARLRNDGIIDDAQHAELMRRAAPPWWLAVFQAIAAWVASLIIMSSFFAPLLMLGDGPFGRAVAGAALAGVALYLFRRRGAFTDQMALAFSLAGQALLVSAVAEHIDTLTAGTRMIWLAGMVLAVAMLLPISTTLHRSMCALIAFAYAAFAIGPGNGLTLYAIAVTALAVAAWLTRSRWAILPQAGTVKALANAASLTALGAAWFIGVEQTRGVLLSRPLEAQATESSWMFALGVVLVLLAAIFWLTRRAAHTLRLAALGGALAFVLAAWQASALIVSAALAIAAFHAGHRPWVMFALLAALLYLGEFYYNLQATLLVKSVVLATSGVVLLGLRLILRAWQRSTV